MAWQVRTLYIILPSSAIVLLPVLTGQGYQADQAVQGRVGRGEEEVGADLAGLGDAGQAGEVALPALGHRGGHQAGAGGAGQQMHQVRVADQAGVGRRNRA